jgi:DNA-binding response OmpR family regulator
MGAFCVETKARGIDNRQMTEKRCILVVEDEPLVSEMVADALSDSYRTVVVDAAADALEQIRLGGVDLILLAYLLPGGGSTQVVAAAEAAGLPVVIMSGDAERSSELSSGSHPFVAKPFGIESLVGAVQAALGKEA